MDKSRSNFRISKNMLKEMLTTQTSTWSVMLQEMNRVGTRFLNEFTFL